MKAIKGRVEFEKIETKSLTRRKEKKIMTAAKISCPLCQRTFVESRRKKGGRLGKNNYQVPAHPDCLGGGMLVTV